MPSFVWLLIFQLSLDRFASDVEKIIPKSCLELIIWALITHMAGFLASNI